MPKILVFFSAAVALIAFGCSSSDKPTEVNILKDVTPYANAGLINVYIEIPAGTNEKWETNKTTGAVEWSLDSRQQKRIVNYLPYPANYGMIPQTWLPPEQGGDNDPLDVFLLGPSVERGSVIEARLVGVMRVLDKGENDDKLIAVDPNGPFKNVTSFQQLQDDYPGVLEILETWLQHYKGNDKMNLLGSDDELVAAALLETAVQAYQTK